jgi:proton glutamate symport protein
MASARPFWKELHWQIFIAMVLGLLSGALLPAFTLDIGFLGDIFLKLLKFVIIPLITFSLASGVASIGNLRGVGRIGAKTFLYYGLTTACAIVIGLVLVNVIHPGRGVALPLQAAPEHVLQGKTTVGAILLGLIPDNPLAAMASSNYLQVIFFALAVGAFLTLLEGERRRVWVTFVDGGFELFMKMTSAIIRLAPIGVFALLGRTIAEVGLGVLKPLAWYMLTVALALVLQAFVVLPLLVRLLARRPAGAYARAFSPALLTAFSTASSNATLPLSMECAEERAGISNRIASFVLPLGATINMNGTALYEAIAALFIAQVYGIGLTLGQQLIVLLTALLAGVGSAGIPMAGLVMMAIVLRSVGLPLEGIGYIIGVDRILDMARTTVNVWGDMVGCAVVGHSEGE